MPLFGNRAASSAAPDKSTPCICALSKFAAEQPGVGQPRVRFRVIKIGGKKPSLAEGGARHTRLREIHIVPASPVPKFAPSNSTPLKLALSRAVACKIAPRGALRNKAAFS